MQGLEKILEEINAEFDRHIGTQLKIMAGTNDDVYRYGYGKSLEAYQQGKLFVEDIIRKHMNDGWIPIDDRLPTMEEYQKDDGRVILDDGNRRCAGYFDVYTGRFYSYRHITPYRAELYEDNGIIAWRPLPEPYCPERSENEI